MTHHRWIIGRGLLGEAVARASGRGVFQVAIPWTRPDDAVSELAAGIDRFLSSTAGPAQIAWCAGRGVTSSAQEALDTEVAVFEGFLHHVLARPQADRERLAVFLASSVGAAYGGAQHPPFTEATPVRASSPYGLAKLRMEEALRSATERGGWRALIGRITNLYGPGQDLRKNQGLISVVVASTITGSPVRVYVSLDTLRDYIYEDDCARIVVAAIDRVAGEPPGTTVVKIIGAMAAISIGAIIGETRRLRRRQFPVILAGGGDPNGQSLDLRVRSQVWTDLDELARTTFPAGVNAVLRSQLAEWARGPGAAR